MTDIITPHKQIAGYVRAADYLAYSMLVADDAGDPLPLEIAASSVVGRAATGGIVDIPAADLGALIAGEIDPNFVYAGPTIGVPAYPSFRALVASDIPQIAHSSLSGLTSDDHSIYVLLDGRTGGQTIIGGTTTTADLILRATAGIGASGSDVIIQTGNNGDVECARFGYAGRTDIGTSALARGITIGNVTGTTAIDLKTGTGAFTVTAGGIIDLDSAGAFTLNSLSMALVSGGIFDVDAVGVVSLNSTGGAIRIGNDADAFGINIGTGAAERAINIGNGTAATALNLYAGTAGITASTTGIFDVNSTGAITLDSTAGTIGIGTGADAFGINIGTGAAARVITIGNATGATGVAINTGSGDFCVNTNQLYVDQATGFVGVGSSPSYLLHTTQSAASASNILIGGGFSRIGGAAAGSDQRGVGLVFQDSNNFTITAGVAGVRTDAGGSYSGDLAFYANIGGSSAVDFSDLTEWMRIVGPNGFVGFGTSTPLQKIDLQSGAIRFDYMTTLSAAGCTLAAGAAGVCTNGVHSIKLTAVNALGETELGTVSPNYTVLAGEQIDVTNLPVSTDPTCTGRYIHMCKAGLTTWYRVALLNNVDTSYSINVADAGLTVAGPAVNTTSGKIYNGAIPGLMFDSAGGYVLGGNGTLTQPAAGYAYLLAGANGLLSIRNNLGSIVYANITTYGVSSGGAGICTAGEAFKTTGQSAQSFSMVRHTTANTAGNSLSVIAGGATVAATDKDGGPLYLKPGQSTGTGSASSSLWATPVGAAGTTTNDPIQVLTCAPLSGGAAGSIAVGIGTLLPSSFLDIERAGTAKAVTDFLELTNTVNAADMDGTGTAILWNQRYYDAATPAVLNAAKIVALCETDWTSVAGTQNSALTFWTRSSRGLEETARLDSQTNFLLGVTAADANVRKAITIGMTTAEPSGAVADAIQIYSSESSDGNATLGLYLEQAVEAIGTFTASHKIKLKLNGTEYWVQLDAVTP